MNPALEQTFNIIRQMPLSRKITMLAVLSLVVAGFVVMFFWANQIDYQPLFSNMSPEDTAEVVEKLKEQNIAYKLVGGGSGILVPAEKIYDVRLAMAGSGLPRGGAVGFEIFDENDFGATEFVQKLNYQRALQGELARTIKEFREVIDARVLIVMPKESVFVEESKPPSASVLLKLRSNLSREKIRAVVNLVAGAIENMKPEQVTVVDTTGKVLNKGTPEDEKAGTLANTQLEYKMTYEQNVSRRIQTMLEQIVGAGKAIVRVTADMDFDRIDLNEEIYDPDAQVVRSRQNVVESSDEQTEPVANVSSTNTAGALGASKKRSDKSTRQDETVNYEINRTVRRTIKPVGRLTRLSVSAVLDGTYADTPNQDGQSERKFVARSAQELEQFKTVIRNAMGFDADRGDQIAVESLPFAFMQDLETQKQPPFDYLSLLKQYGRSLFNLFLVLLVFLFVVRPMIKGVKDIKSAVIEPVLPQPPTEAALEAEKKEALPEPEEVTMRNRADELARQDVDKSANLVRGWLGDAS